MHLFLLPDAVRPVRRLVFLRRIPPTAEMDHVIRRSDIESHAAGLRRKDKHREAFLSVEFIHHPLASSAIHLSINRRLDGNLKYFFQESAKQSLQLSRDHKDQRLFLLLSDLHQSLEKHHQSGRGIEKLLGLHSLKSAVAIGRKVRAERRIAKGCDDFQHLALSIFFLLAEGDNFIISLSLHLRHHLRQRMNCFLGQPIQVILLLAPKENRRQLPFQLRS